MSSAKVKARLKALRKKYHLGEFRKTKRVVRKVKNRVVRMAKKRRSFRYSYKKSHRKSSGGMLGLGGLNLFELGMMGVGAGFAGTVGGLVNKYSNGKVTGNTAQAVSGVAIYFVGKKLAGGKYTTPIAKGILIKTIGDMVEDHVVPMVSGAIGQTTTSSASF